MSRSQISVIIPVYNAQDTITIALESLLNQTYPPLEVILIDNNSTDEGMKEVKVWQEENSELNLLLLEELKQGPSAARNKGIKHSKGNIIAFMDADCLATENWLETISDFFSKNEQVTAVGGIINSYQPTSFIEHYWAITHMIHNKICPNYNPSIVDALFRNNFIIPHNAAIHKERFGDFQFDEDFIYGEDLEFTLNSIKNQKLIVTNCNQIKMYHIERKKYFSFGKQIFNYRTYFAKVTKKHFPNKAILVFSNKKIYTLNSPFAFTLSLKFFLVSTFSILTIIFMSSYFLQIIVTILIPFFANQFIRVLKYHQYNFKKIFHILGLTTFNTLINFFGFPLKVLGSIKFKYPCLL